MNQIDKMKLRWKGLSDTTLRFSFSILMLVAAVISNAVAINTQDDGNYIKLLITFVLGASIYIVLQLTYERFYEKPLLRICFIAVSLVCSLGYYLIIRKTNWEVDVTIRTIIIQFLLLIAFLWVPVIKSRINFNESFMAAFKAFFISSFFTGVLFLGVCLILGATDMLIADIAGEAYQHAANIIFVLLAPIYFLSLIPVYPGKRELLVELSNKPNRSDIEKEVGNLEEQVVDIKLADDNLSVLQKLITPTKFLETLISYVIIPITAVFTVILLLYIVLNITGSFWSDNLLEPLLVSYSITVILVYLLASTLKSVFALYFRMVFPKVLVLVVLFQTLSSILRIGELGITYGRYYVILFGIFATIAGIIFSILPVHKNGLIAPILMALTLLSVIPPVDAFTVSKANQIGRLENALESNQMLENDMIIPNTNVSKEDRNTIVASINYLNRMEYTEDVKWLSTYRKDLNFERTFGFAEYEQVDKDYLNIYLERDDSLPISVEGYDYLITMNYYNETMDLSSDSIEHGGKSYGLFFRSFNEDNSVLILNEVDGEEIIQFEMNEIFNRFANSSLDKSVISYEEAIFTKDNEAISLKLIVNTINISEWENGKDKQVNANILIKIK
jgi:hypothetical protein